MGGQLLGWSLRALFCSMLLAVGLWYFSPPDTQWLSMLPLARVGCLALIVLVGLMGYVVALFLFGLRPRHLRNHGATL
jgi:putative peptidoglycan lipid II flippase